MQIKTWFDKDTYTLTYCVYDAATKDAVVIDAVWDYDQASGAIRQNSVNEVTEFIKSQQLKLHYILETHAHADHLTGAQPLKKNFPEAKVAIGSGIVEVQKVFKSVFNLGDHFAVDGRQFDVLLADGSETKAGSLTIKTMFTPGHTPACASYLIGDAVFTGDALFMPDSGTGRCDFPAGSAELLFDSIQKLYKLPDSTRLFTGHDYQPNGRPLSFESTIGEQKKSNIQLKDTTSKAEYVAFRTARDKTLSAPRLLLPSIQVNIDAGRLPAPESNGKSYLKTPLKLI
jgi:glyoxylase-like metal-dependent hydrolase (beta-lactamase superfamily II)